MQDALTLTTRAIEAVQAELDAHAAGRGRVGNPRQLMMFRDTLNAMRSQLESGDLPPRAQRPAGMGRVIGDSWPFDSELGALILEAEERYLRS